MISLEINGQKRPLELALPVSLEGVLDHLGVQPDRVAVELNDAIVARSRWPEILVAPNDRLEIVHFVGGGAMSSMNHTEYVLSDVDDVRSLSRQRK